MLTIFLYRYFILDCRWYILSDGACHMVLAMTCFFFTEKETKKTVSKFNPIAFREAKIVYSFGLSVCNRVN